MKTSSEEGQGAEGAEAPWMDAWMDTWTYPARNPGGTSLHLLPNSKSMDLYLHLCPQEISTDTASHLYRTASIPG